MLSGVTKHPHPYKYNFKEFVVITDAFEIQSPRPDLHIISLVLMGIYSSIYAALTLGIHINMYM